MLSRVSLSRYGRAAPVGSRLGAQGSHMTNPSVNHFRRTDIRAMPYASSNLPCSMLSRSLGHRQRVVNAHNCASTGRREVDIAVAALGRGPVPPYILSGLDLVGDNDRVRPWSGVRVGGWDDVLTYCCPRKKRVVSWV